jgi:uncharacterized protein
LRRTISQPEDTVSDQPNSNPPQDAPQPPGSGQPVPPPPPGFQQAATPQGPLSQGDERMWSMISHLGGIVAGLLAPLIVWLVFRERSTVVNDQGKESLNFQITVLIGWVAAGILSSIVPIGYLLYPLVLLANLILCIIAGLAAQRGEQYRYPFALRLVK